MQLVANPNVVQLNDITQLKIHGNMNKIRLNPGVAVLNDKIYVFGNHYMGGVFLWSIMIIK